MSNQTPDLDRVVDRIQKLLALSKSSEPHEAAAALRQAQKFMEKYNLDMNQVKLSSIIENKVKSCASVSQVKPWEGRLMATVAKAFACHIIWTSGYSHNPDPYGRFTFIGEKNQVEVATYTATVLIRKILSARAKFSKTLGEWLTRQQKTAEIDGFLMGWVVEIAGTIHAFSGQPELLALVSQYVEKNHPALASKKTQDRKLGVNGYQAGREAGSRESLQRPITQGAQQMRLGQSL